MVEDAPNGSSLVGMEKSGGVRARTRLKEEEERFEGQERNEASVKRGEVGMRPVGKGEREG